MPLDSARLCGDLGCSSLVREPLPKRGGDSPSAGGCGVLSWHLGDRCVCVCVGLQVAIKSIRKDKIKDEQDLVHIRREIEIMSSLNHPHIIAVHEGEPHCHLLSLPAASLTSPAALAGAVPPLPRCSLGNYQLQNLPRALPHTLGVCVVFKSLAP